MNTLKFITVEDFCDFVTDALCEITDEELLNDVTIVAKYEEMKEIFSELIRCGYECTSVDAFHPPDFEGYNDEYLLLIYNNELWLALARDDAGTYYDNSDASKVFILDNCSSKVISTVNPDNAFEVNIEELEENDEESMCCDCCKKCKPVAEILKDKDDNVCGVTITKYTDNGCSTYSYYNSNGLSDDELIEKLEFDF